VQRLGYLLEIIETEDINHKNRITSLLQQYIKVKNPKTIALNPNLPITGFPRHPVWRVAINSEVESDL
jgi:hypothetical protein